MGIPYAQEEAYNAEHCIQTVEEEAKQASHLTVLTDIQFCVNILSAKRLTYLACAQYRPQDFGARTRSWTFLLGGLFQSLDQ